MRLGMTVTGAWSAEEPGVILARAVGMECDGWRSAWIPSGIGPDPMLLMSLIAASTSVLELGSFVVPAISRHPVALAREALTIAAQAGRTPTLGIGLGHPEHSAYTRLPASATPLTYMREFLEVLRLCLRGGRVRYSGQAFEVNTTIGLEPAPCSLVLAAARPHMLSLAADLTDGLVTWLFGLRHLEAAVKRVDQRRTTPGRVIAGFPMAITADTDAAGSAVAQLTERYRRLRNHRATLDAQPGCAPGDLALIGDEPAVARRIEQLASVGVTDVVGAWLPIPSDPDSVARTYQFVTDHVTRQLKVAEESRWE